MRLASEVAISAGETDVHDVDQPLHRRSCAGVPDIERQVREPFVPNGMGFADVDCNATSSNNTR